MIYSAACHSRESGNPFKLLRPWTPAFAGMTARIGRYE